MLMPETPVYEDDFAESWEDHIWNPWKFSHMQPVTEPHTVYQAADKQLGAGIRASNA